jgi:hypothetical protein
MKKLMIATAAAALVGVAGAVPTAPSLGVVYDATFSLKTTVGRSANDTQTYNLGSDGNSPATFWYEDPTLTTWIDATDPTAIKLTTEGEKYFTFKKIGKVNVPTLSNDGLKNPTVLNALIAIAPAYPAKSAGKHCMTFKSTDPVCYRVAGTISYAGHFYDDECLTALVGGSTASLANPLINAFGAAIDVDWINFKVKSTKAEVYADDIATTLFLLKDGDIPVDILDNNKGVRSFTVLSIAGHGTYGYVYDDTNRKQDWPGVTALSGNVVGLASQPECVFCCTPNQPAVTFDCCGYVAAQPDTAVFGTFSIKYNNSKTVKKLY